MPVANGATHVHLGPSKQGVWTDRRDESPKWIVRGYIKPDEVDAERRTAATGDRIESIDDFKQHYRHASEGGNLRGLFEAKAAGAEHTKWDDMDSATLRKRIAKFKAMGDKAPAQALIRANQALARKLAMQNARVEAPADLATVLRESWEEFDAARKAGKFGPIKTGPMPGSWKDSPGRGPTGKMRNFNAMSEAKLSTTLKALALHGEDPQAHLAAMEAAGHKLGVKFDTKTGNITMPAKLANAPTGQLSLA